MLKCEAIDASRDLFCVVFTNELDITCKSRVSRLIVQRLEMRYKMEHFQKYVARCAKFHPEITEN